MIRNPQMLIAVNCIASVWDGLFTLHGIKSNLCTEVNPIMNWMIKYDPFVFLSFKMFWVFALLILLYELSEKMFRIIAPIVTVLYVTLIAYHVFFLFVL